MELKSVIVLDRCFQSDGFISAHTIRTSWILLEASKDLSEALRVVWKAAKDRLFFCDCTE